MAGSSNGMVILDDRNPEIVYSTGWGFDWDPLAAYNSTFHLAGAQGLSASLTYVGTQVIVKGCVGTAPDHVAGQVLATYSVDGKSYGSTNVDDLTVSSTTVQFCNATLFASPTLPHGQHRLEVTTNNIAPNELWIDSFSYMSTDVSVVSQALHSTVTSAAEPSTPTATAGGSRGSTATARDSRSPTATTGKAPNPTDVVGGTLGTTTTSGETLGPATSTDPGSSTSGSTHPHSFGSIIGGSAAAAIIIVLLAILTTILLLRRRLTRRESIRELLRSRSSSQLTFASDTMTSPLIVSAATFPEKAYIRSVTSMTSAPDATSHMPSLPSPTTPLSALASQLRPMIQLDQPDNGSMPPSRRHSREPPTRTSGRGVSFASSLNPPYTWKDWPLEGGASQGGVMRNVTTPDMSDSEARSSVVRYSNLTSGPPSYTSLPTQCD